MIRLYGGFYLAGDMPVEGSHQPHSGENQPAGGMFGFVPPPPEVNVTKLDPFVEEIETGNRRIRLVKFRRPWMDFLLTITVISKPDPFRQS